MQKTQMMRLFIESRIMKAFVITLILIIKKMHAYESRTDVDHQLPLWPSFIQEPPSKVTFYNSTGAVVACIASGRPQPTITWTLVESIGHKFDAMISHQLTPNHIFNLAKDIPGLRHSRPDGSLVFPPFSHEQHNEQIHSRTYRCIASNNHGTVVSRNVQIKGVIQQAFEVRVYDEFVIPGNTGVLRCQLPSYLLEYVSLSAWIRSDGYVIKPYKLAESDSKYLIFATGELHIKSVHQEDSDFTFRCQITDHLTGKITLSSSAGRLIVTESQAIAPRFVHRVSAMKARSNSVALIPCAAEAYPSIAIKWYKHAKGSTIAMSSLSSLSLMQLSGRRIQEHSDGTLIITEVNPEDSGSYMCVVNNNIGEQKSLTQLTVVVPLKVVIKASTKRVTIASSLTINCSIIGYPIANIVWLKDGRPVNIDAIKYKSVSRDTITIESIAFEDKGIYQCLIANEEDSAQASIMITISSEPPTLTVKPENITVPSESRVSLRCAAKGNPLPQIMWTSYGQPVLDSGTFRIGDYVSSDGSVISFINISRIGVQEGGKYECKAINDVGSDSTAIWISVIGAPFIKPMNNATVVAGNTLQMDCPFSAHHLSSIHWYKGFRALPLNRRQMVFPNGTLVIQSVFRAEDEGEYKCVVRNSDNEAFDRSVHVKVIVAPTIAAFNFAGVLQEGMRASVTCTVTTGDPPIEMRWFKDGNLLVSQDGVYLENVDDFISNLIFKPLKQEHSGLYSCIASNGAAAVNHTVSLSVDAPPRWRIEPSDKSAIVGHSLTIDCQAYGKPEPRVLWKKMNEESITGNYKTVISGSRVQTLVNGSLYFLDIISNDSGTYLCEASNGIGSAITAVIRVTVNVPAHFVDKYRSVKSRKEEKVELNCKAYGESPMHIKWTKDGQSLEKSLHQFDLQEESSSSDLISKLIILKVRRSDSGLFACKASNPFGNDEKHIELTVQEKPDIPNALKVTTVNSRSIQAKWTKPFDGNNPILKYTLQYKEANGVWQRNVKELTSDGSRTDMFIRNLLPLTAYQLRIRAENEIGQSDWSDALAVTTEEEVPEVAPKHIQVKAVSSRMIKVSWQMPLSKHQFTKVTGFYVGHKKYDSKDSFIFKTVKSDSQESKYTTELNELSKMTKYVIVVQAYNGKGAGPLSEEMIAETAQFDAPRPPQIKVTSVTSSTIDLTWTPFSEEDNPIFGYVVMYRKEEEHQWHESQLMADVTSHSLSSVQCGTMYLIAMLAFNTLGRGKPSETLSVRTKGSVPIAPEKENLIAVNSTFLHLHLNSWNDGDCPIDYFSIQYKPQSANTFIQLLDDVYLPDKIVPIRNLEPASYYNIWIAARNGAGVTEAQYRIATLTENGEYLHQQGNTSDVQFVSIILPLLSIIFILLIVAVFVVAFLFCHRGANNTSALDYDTSTSDRSRKNSECFAMNEIHIEKPNYERHMSCDEQFAHEECVYLPSAYASTRISANSFSCEQIERSHFMARQASQSFSNVYDTPQIRYPQNGSQIAAQELF